MEQVIKLKTKAKPVTRAVLNEESAAKLEAWAKQVSTMCPGIRLKRQDLVNWLLSQKTDQLTSSDLKSVKEQFYDEIELAAWALRELKAARSRNETTSLNSLIRTGIAPASGTANKVRATRKPRSQSPDQLPQIEAGAGGGHSKAEVL